MEELHQLELEQWLEEHVEVLSLPTSHEEEEEEE